MRLHPKIVPTTQAGLDELRARPEATDDISNIIELSQRSHASIALSATEGTDKEKLSKHIFEYPTQMLRYSQLAGFYLIYAYLICDLAHPIMKDSYMQTYALCFTRAYDISSGTILN
ncbi:hypothetical protein T08_16021 [Trichinella sp. T8]|nr:hypothetical protein T08_16021 [Trichinella sp. T8]